MTIIRLLIKFGNPLQQAFYPSNAATPSPHSFAVLKDFLRDVRGMFRGTNLRKSPDTITEPTGLHLYSEIKISFEKPSNTSIPTDSIVAFKNSICNPQTSTIKGGVA